MNIGAEMHLFTRVPSTNQQEIPTSISGPGHLGPDWPSRVSSVPSEGGRHTGRCPRGPRKAPLVSSQPSGCEVLPLLRTSSPSRRNRVWAREPHCCHHSRTRCGMVVLQLHREGLLVGPGCGEVSLVLVLIAGRKPALLWLVPRDFSGEPRPGMMVKGWKFVCRVKCRLRRRGTCL